MHSYSRLGTNGRLGNQMFQYAALYGLGFLRGREVGIPVTGHDLYRAFPSLSATPLETVTAEQLYREPKFEFNEGIWLCPDNTDIDGYFQSEQYFYHCTDRIREEFRFASGIDRLATEFLKQANPDDNPICSIHMRRGDYLQKADYHTVLGSEYYNAALSMVQQQIENVKFLAFSDDVEWVKTILPPEILVVDTSENNENSPIIDMCIMSKCHVHVIANSSFSWWGAWLSGSKAVIAPQQWFGPKGPDTWETVYAHG